MNAPAPNRRARRRHRRRAQSHGLACCCDDCRARRTLWPAYYVGNGRGAVYAACQWPDNPEDKRRHPEGDLGRLVSGLAWDCFQEANAPKERSASAVAIDWLTDRYVSEGGYKTSEVELRPASVDGELARFASLREWLIGQGLSDVERIARERRYLELCEAFGGLRLHQWLRGEFPGWMNGEVPAAFAVIYCDS